jgi:hypothetical protein
MIEELKALIDAALEEQLEVDLDLEGTEVSYSKRQLGEFVMDNGQAILSALSAVPVMKEALQAVMRDGIGDKVGGGDGNTYVTRPLSGATLKQVSQALAALGAKP